MSLLLYRQTYPATALVLAGDAYTLTFRRPANAPGSSTSSSPRVELAFEPISQFDVVGCTLLGHVHGTLGLVQLAKELFLAVITSAQSLTSKYTPEEEVARIQSVDFYSLSSTAWDDPAGALTAGGYDGNGSASGTSTPGGGGDLYNLDHPMPSASSQGQLFEHPASSMRKILSNNHFYFSSGAHDVSTRLEERIRRRDQGGDGALPYDSRFVWNSFLMDSIMDFRDNLSFQEKSRFDQSGFVVAAIQGFVGVSDFTLSGNPVSLSLVSRLGFARAGTRFNTRGIDDDGNVANFVETETILRTQDSVFSFVQIRGSVPLFWEQQGTTPFGGQRLQVTRPAIASQPAFNKHFSSLLSAYPHVQAVNLLSSKDHEALLSNAYREHVRNANAQLGDKHGLSLSSEKASLNSSSDDPEIGYTEFDFHSKAKLAGGIESVRELVRRDPELGGRIENFGYCLAAADGGEKGLEMLLSKQDGVFRTNCLDTLDRTNVVQDIFSRLAVEQYLRNLFPSWATSEILLGSHRTLWAENGDALSRIYAGTGALNTSFTRSGKRTLAGALSDATKSVSRMYISNFVDKGKQTAIDGLLGHLPGQSKVVVVDPVRDSVDSALRHRESEFTSETTYSLFCGTFNVNGKVPGSESLLPWLFPDSDFEPDILALGFQELVELSPQQIMATDPEKMRRWQTYITNALAGRPNAKSQYVLLRAEQLVGTALILMIKTSIAPHVKNVEAAAKKTGLKGMAGNKGAVAIRLELDDSSFCFVTAHFAAGHSNFEQRNMDYATIAGGLHFRKGKKIVSHDNVLYFGDLNYRIQLPNEEVRHLATSDDFADLIEGDQLTLCLKTQSVFAGYSEGPLVFRPTYKYDNLSEVYDTSEKQRIPSWTDRVLYKGKSLALIRYNRAELLMSDHRPVYASFKVNVNVVNHAKREQIARELLSSVKPGNDRTATIGHATLSKAFDSTNGSLGRHDVGSHDLGRVPDPTAGPSSEPWWKAVDYATVRQARQDNLKKRNPGVTNPFEIDFFVEENGLNGSSAHPALQPKPAINQIKRKVPPAVSSSKPTLPPRSASQSSLSVVAEKNGISHPSLNRKASATSLIDEDAEEQVKRPVNKREATTEWQVIMPSAVR